MVGSMVGTFWFTLQTFKTNKRCIIVSLNFGLDAKLFKLTTI